MKLYKYLFGLTYLISLQFVHGGGADFLALKNSKTLGLNGIYLAGTDGVLGSRFNPATLSNLTGYGFELTALDKLGDQSINSATGDKFTSFRNDDFNILIGAHAKIFNDLSIGLTYSPELRFDVNWPYARVNTDGSSSIITAHDLQSVITINSISPIISYNVGSLSIGIAAHIYNAKLDYSYPKSNLLWNENIGLPGYDLDFNFEGWSYGFTIGLLYQLNNEISIAMAVQSASEIDVDGKLNSTLFTEVLELPGSVDASTKWENPWKITIGGLYKFSQNLALNIDASMSIYSNSKDNLKHNIANNSIANELTTPDSLIGLAGSGLEVNFKNSFNIGIGLEYAPSGSLIYRFGYLFNQSSQEKSMYSHLFPNIDNHWFSAGVGIIQDKFLIDVTVSYGLGRAFKIGDETAVFGGEYSSQLFLPSLTIKYNM